MSYIPSFSLPFQKRESVVVGSTTNSVTFSGLNGAVEEEYLIRYYILHAESPTQRDFIFLPNGVQGSLPCYFVGAVGTGSGDPGTRLNGVLAAGTVREQITGFSFFYAKTNPGGSGLSFERRFDSFTTIGDNPPLLATTGLTRANGLFSDLVSNITSLEIACTEINNPAVAANGIGAGSIFELWSLVIS